jgi:hypothetical protein
MFGIGKLIGGVLESVGLGQIAPFVSLAANVFTGNWAGVAQDIMGLVSKFAGNDFSNNVDKQPPLGGFEDENNVDNNPVDNTTNNPNPVDETTDNQNPIDNTENNFQNTNTEQTRKPLDSNRITDLFKGLKNLFEGIRDLMNGDIKGLQKIFEAFQVIKDFTDNQQLFNDRSNLANTTQAV